MGTTSSMFATSPNGPLTSTAFINIIKETLTQFDISKLNDHATATGYQEEGACSTHISVADFTKHRNIEHYKKKQVIYTEGNHPVKLFYIEKGKVKIIKTNDDGKELTVGLYSEGDFVGYMNSLGLPHPKLIDIAVPANLRCGRPANDAPPASEPTWAPLDFTFAGIYEIKPEALEEIAGGVQIVDVRANEEFAGPLGHIASATLMPLPELATRSAELSREKPIVAVCRSGARSAQAVVLLQKAGFKDVANLAGGMLRWRAEGHRVAGGRD